MRPPEMEIPGAGELSGDQERVNRQFDLNNYSRIFLKLQVYVRLFFWQLFTYGKFRAWASLRLDQAIVDWEELAR